MVNSPHLVQARGIWIFGLALVLGAIGSPEVTADFPALGDVTGATSGGDGALTISIGPDRLIVRVCTPQIVQIDFQRNGQADDPTPVIADPARAWPGDPAVTIDTTGNPIVVKTTRLRVEIARSPCRLTLFDSSGQKLLGEPASGGVFVIGTEPDPGGLRFEHGPGQHFYGITAQSAGDAINDPNKVNGTNSLLRDGGMGGVTHQARAWVQGGAGAPFVWTTSGYGLLIDSDNGYIQLTGTALNFFYGRIPDDMDRRRYDKRNNLLYYLFVGSPKEILRAAAEVSGFAPMFPRWAMGFTNSQWGIDETELIRIVGLYRAKDIPIDNFTLDFDWKAWGEDHFGEFRWNATKFPDAERPDGAGSVLKTLMDGLGVKMTGIMKPRIVRCVTAGQDAPFTEQATDANSKGLFYPDPRLANHPEYLDPRRNVDELDFKNPNCRAWYWDKIRRFGAMEKGIAGFWNDEADSADVGNGTQVVFDNFEHFHMQQALYEGQRQGRTRAATPRVWSLNRNFYLGAQRFAYAMWSGDIGTGFNNMADQPGRMLAVVALGQPKWGMDTGGFFDDPIPENYARWVQFSALVPIFRVHGTQYKHRQPWAYGPVAEEVAKAVIRWRYGMSPYIYAAERNAFELGVGLVRPLMVEFPDDPQSADVPNQWMFGDWLLAAPVLRQQNLNTAGQSTDQTIYLPPGKWIDYSRGDVLDGGRTIHYAINPGVWTDTPLFLRQGAILLSQAVTRSLGEVRPTQVEVDAFPFPTETATTFYDDDGATYAYEDAVYLKQRIAANAEAGALSLSIAGKKGSYPTSVQTFLVRMHGRAGTSVTLNGVPLAAVGGLDQLRTAPQGWLTGRDVYGPLTYVKVPAAQAGELRVRISGDAPLAQKSERFEAEDASLAGATTATRAKIIADVAGYTGQGYVTGFEIPETAITFYVKRATAGKYRAILRAANDGGGPGNLDLYVNGAQIGKATVPVGSWVEVPLPLPLAAGNNIVTLRRDLEGPPGVLVDALTIPFAPVASRYEAESAALDGGANTNLDHTHYSGIAFIDRLTAPGAMATFTVIAPNATDYTLTTHYANANGAARTMSLYVNGTRIKAVTFAPTVDWDTWEDEVERVTLPAGPNSISLKYDPGDSGHVNLDYILLAPASQGTGRIERP
jgi:alpha-glucosidase (family GH31 glycosyl hydrolase)